MTFREEFAKKNERIFKHTGHRAAVVVINYETFRRMQAEIYPLMFFIRCAAGLVNIDADVIQQYLGVGHVLIREWAADGLTVLPYDGH